MTAILITLYYWNIYKSTIFSPMFKIPLLLKELYKGCYRGPTWTRLIMKFNNLSDRKRTSVPEVVHHIFLSFC